MRAEGERSEKKETACMQFVDMEVQERDQDIERAESMLRMMRERELRERNRETALREKAKGTGSSRLASVVLSRACLA